MAKDVHLNPPTPTKKNLFITSAQNGQWGERGTEGSCRAETHQREEASNKLQNWKLIPLRATGGCVEHSYCKENRNRASWYKILMSTFSPLNTRTPHPRLDQGSSLKSFTIDSRFFSHWLARFPPNLKCYIYTYSSFKLDSLLPLVFGVVF